MAFFRCGSSRLIIVSALLPGSSFFGSDALAQRQMAPVRVEQSAINANVGGVHLCIPGKWSVLDLVVTNPLDEPQDIISATYFDGAPTLQYGRRVWVPARARLTTWSPVLLPKLPAGSAPQFTIHSVVFDPTRPHEVLQREAAGGLVHSGPIPARLDRPITGFMGSAALNTGELDPAYELVIASRLHQNYSRKLGFFDPQSRIPDDFSLQGVDQLVICNGTIHENLVRMAAIRRWVHAGGVLWVMLDQTDPQILERIAGDEFRCHVVDRVGLTNVRIDSTKAEGESSAPETEYEEPVDLVRVVLAERDMRVDYTVNGWPAAFSKSFGAGRLVATTLGARGWMRRLLPRELHAGNVRGSQERRQELEPQTPQSQFVVLPPMAELSGSIFMVPPVARSSIMDAFDSQAAEYVGYSIPPRWQIAGLLAGFVGAVVALGIWLRHKGALQHLGWSGPALSVMATFALLVVGGLNRHARSDTVAVVDYVQTIAGTDDVRSRGAVTFYRPEAGPWEIATTRGGRLVPDMTGQEGTTRRMVWSDLDDWSWQNLTQTAPQRTARFEQAQTLAHRIEARASFGPDGLTGRLSKPPELALADAILATPNGQLAVHLSVDGTIYIPADGVLGKDQYLAAGMLSDEQNRRRRTNELVLQKLRESSWSGAPLLMLWADRRICNFHFDDTRRSLGASLVSMPLALERPAANTPVRIPAPLLDYRNTIQPGGEQSSPIWDHARREWQEYPGPASVWLKFQVPLELLPLQLTGGRLTIQVTGPLGRLEVFGLRREAGDDRTGAIGGQAVSISQWEQPVGTLSVPLDDSSLLRIATDGCLLLGFSVKGPDRPQSSELFEDQKPSYWRIEGLSLELAGKTLAP